MSAERVAALAGHAQAHAVPLAAALELTQRCPLACRHCYLPEHDRRDRLTTARLLDLVDELAELRCLFLTLTGGEPLLHPGCLEVAEHARRRGFCVTLLTSAFDVDATTARRLAALHVAVEVSVHGADAATFEAATARPGSFARVLAGLEHLRAAGADVLLKLPITRLNHHRLAAVEALAERLDLPLQTFPAIVPARDGSRSPLALRLDACELASLLGSPPADARPPALDAAPCAAGARTLTVTAAGEVLACPLLPVSAGSVLERPLAEIWHTSPWLRRLRGLRTADLGDCAGCDRAAYCARCPGEALLEDGDLCGPSSAACARATARELARERA